MESLEVEKQHEGAQEGEEKTSKEKQQQRPKIRSI